MIFISDLLNGYSLLTLHCFLTIKVELELTKKQVQLQVNEQSEFKSHIKKFITNENFIGQVLASKKTTFRQLNLQQSR